MGSFNIRMLRLSAWSVFLLLAVEYRYTVSSPEKQTSPTDGGAIKDTVATIHPTFSTSVSPSGHTKALPAKLQVPHTTANSTEPPTNQTLFSTSSKVILTIPPSTTPAVHPHIGASPPNGTRTTPAPGEPSDMGASPPNGTRTTPAPGEPSDMASPSNGTITTPAPGGTSNMGASPSNGTITIPAPGGTSNMGASTTNGTITTPATGGTSNMGASTTNGTRTTPAPGGTSNMGASTTNGTRTTPAPGGTSNMGASTTNGTRTTLSPGEPSNMGASSTNGTGRNATWSIIPNLTTNSSSIPGGTTTTTSTASSVPVAKKPCPTPSSTNRTAPPRPGASECTSSPSNVVSKCLVIISLLAAMLTVFFVSTMVLCAKLSSRKYSLGGQRGTEMVCLSAMMTSHSNGTSSRHANLEGHRTLLTSPEDSDEDGGDNLTLNSFLPEGDRMV